MRLRIWVWLVWFLIGPAPLLLAQETETIYLSGTDKDHTVEWDFLCTGGRRSGEWTRIAVPSCWEQQGFGTYNYGIVFHKMVVRDFSVLTPSGRTARAGDEFTFPGRT